MGKRNYDAVRFWALVNGGMVKLRLAKGESVSFGESEETEEGWRSRGETYFYDTGYVIRHEWWSRERDCDGLHETFGETECGVAWLHDQPYVRERWAFDGFRSDPECAYLLPAWEDIRTSQRDHTAERAGY